MVDSSDALSSVCGFSDDNHIVQEPVGLPNCGHSVCRSCISKRHSNKCKSCISNKTDNSNKDVSQITQNTNRLLISQLFKEMKNNFSSKCNSLKGE